ncbi:MAG: NAD-dependent epimerase/dehydratase family protein [Roseiarcus sp.]
MSVALLTGASGFLGRYVCRELASRGMAFVALTRAGGGAIEGASRTISLSRGPSKEQLGAIFEEVRPRAIYQLAGTSRMDDLEGIYRANVLYAGAILEAALASDARPAVLLVGSAAEYGQPVHRDMTVREPDPCNPLSAYGISKLAQTHHGMAAAAKGLPVVVARLFNPIGAGSPTTTALGSFVSQVAAIGPAGGALTTGPLQAVRDFVDAAAAARVLVALAETQAAMGQIVNVSTGIGTGLDEMVRRLVRIAGVPVRHEIDRRRHGTSDLDVVIGDPGRLASLGLAMAPPDFDALLARMLEAARLGERSIEPTM